jgi:hypothetical protein
MATLYLRMQIYILSDNHAYPKPEFCFRKYLRSPSSKTNNRLKGSGIS